MAVVQVSPRPPDQWRSGPLARSSPTLPPPAEEPGGLDLPPLHIERTLPDHSWLRAMLEDQHKELRDQNHELQARTKEMVQLLEHWMREQARCYNGKDVEGRPSIMVPLLPTVSHGDAPPDVPKSSPRSEGFDGSAKDLFDAPLGHARSAPEQAPEPTNGTESEPAKAGFMVSKNNTEGTPKKSLSEAQTTRSRLQRCVQHQWFEAGFGFVVVLNAVFIGYQVDKDEGGPFQDYAQHAFNLVFFVELFFRIGAEGFWSYLCTSKQLAWNYLDFSLVASGVIESVLVVLAWLGSNTGETPDMNHMRLLRIVRLTRLTRVLRLARIVRFVSALQILLHSIVSTLKSMLWVAVLVVLVVYFFGIIFAQQASETDISSKAERFWGSLPRAMFTLFQVMTNGLDWGEVVLTLFEIHWTMVAIFMFFVIFVFFALTNVVTGVFCQAATAAVQRDRDLVVSELLTNKKLYVDKTRDLFTAMFQQMDEDGSGNISLEEFEAHVHDETVQAYFAILELDTSDAYTLFKLMDADGSNAIDAEEFVDGCLKLKGTARSIDLIRLSTETRWLTTQLIQFMANSEAQLAALRAGNEKAFKGLNMVNSDAAITLANKAPFKRREVS